jgi:hypothetical protein
MLLVLPADFTLLATSTPMGVASAAADDAIDDDNNVGDPAGVGGRVTALWGVAPALLLVVVVLLLLLLLVTKKSASSAAP